ncbi:glycosyltransferase family 87 protein [Flavobacterium sp.]|uniref:glycosyltransferase family 87 protein n=1 Tax=Flavobacterium sp. TaxID=239 RepID=UPI002B4B418D|nr:glycosyltransferase family 87 protein [Flavobacterium sp.]HLP62928.1 glycosyltransferase family 87 protein [Flavobacterium sp.]
MRKLIRQHYGLIAIALFCAFCLFKAMNFPVHDFANYYFGGQFLVNGQFNSNTYFPYLFNKQIADLGYSGIFASYAPNTPFLALLFTPFSLLSLAASKLVFNIISVSVFLISLYRLTRFYKIKSIYIVFIPLLFFVPIKNELLFGQVYFVLFFFLTEFWLAYQKERLLKSAFFLSLAILLKVFPVVLLLIFLFKKEFKLLLYTFGICFLLIGISTLFTGFDVWLFWLNSVLPRASNGEIATAYVDNYQSVFMFLKRLLVANPIENLNAIYHSPLLFKALIFAYKIKLIVIGYFVTKRISNSLFVFSFWIMVSILLSPYGSTYTFILLIFIYFNIIKSEISTNKKWMFFGLLLYINSVPISYLLHQPFPVSYLRLLTLLLLFIGIVVPFYQKINWKIVTVLSLVALMIPLFLEEKNNANSTSFLMKQSPILIYDYQIKNKELTYYYWNEKGENQRKLKLCKYNVVELPIKNNQIFYNNQQLTFDKSNKLKPILINGEIVVFLSDYNKGIGFYSLQKIALN